LKKNPFDDVVQAIIDAGCFICDGHHLPQDCPLNWGIPSPRICDEEWGVSEAWPHAPWIGLNPYTKRNMPEAVYPSRQGPYVQYKNLVEQGKLQHDTYQERVASELENLLARLEQYEKDMQDYHEKLANWEKKREDEHRSILMNEAEHIQQNDTWSSIKKKPKKLVDSWVSRKMTQGVEHGVGKWVSYLNRERKLDSLVGPRPIAPVAPKGLYLYGNVGSGKTMLMDMFYSATEGLVKHRRRSHFNEVIEVLKKKERQRELNESY
ncbi:hypothetical protein KSS87_022115, partial [Heliosperma pusillum]